MKIVKVLFAFCLITILFAVPTAFAEISIGGMYGGVSSMTDSAVEGFQDTEWTTNGVAAASIMFRKKSGFAIEILTEKLKMNLMENGVNFGTLTMQPILLLLKIQGMPQGDSGWAGHAEIGGGINKTSFEKGPFVTGLERTYGVKYAVTTDSSFIFEMGAGADYFFTRNLSLSLDFKMLMGNVGTSWSVSGPGGSANLSEINNFYVSQIQYLGGLRLWF